MIGTDKPEAIAELIALSVDLLGPIGLKNIELHIGNLKLLSLVFDAIKLTDDQKQLLLPSIDKEEFEDVEDLLIQWNINNEKITDVLKLLKDQDLNSLYQLIETDEQLTKEINRMNEIFDLVKHQFSIDNAQINMGIVRGLDYYSGIVFEVKAPSLGAEKQICGGGEYNLISLFGGRDSPTAGFALGFDRTILALEEEHHSFPEKKLDCYLIAYNDELIPVALQLASKLRRNHNVTCDIDLLRRGIGKALKHASSKNASYAIILGPREMEEEKVTLRDMTSGKQQEVNVNALTKNPFSFLK